MCLFCLRQRRRPRQCTLHSSRYRRPMTSRLSLFPRPRLIIYPPTRKNIQQKLPPETGLHLFRPLYQPTITPTATFLPYTTPLSWTLTIGKICSWSWVSETGTATWRNPRPTVTSFHTTCTPSPNPTTATNCNPDFCSVFCSVYHAIKLVYIVVRIIRISANMN